MQVREQYCRGLPLVALISSGSPQTGQFEQVMTYYWVTEAQRYIQSSGSGLAASIRRGWRGGVVGVSVPDAVSAVARDEFGAGVAAAVTAAFEARGIL